MEISNHPAQPFVSVIVPVYNDPERIKTCIEALRNQTYPRDCYEVLIADNGSTDETPTVVQQYGVTLLLENKIQGSYAARNAALRVARGDIIAFTDSDCTPVAAWIAEGVRALNENNADLAGGNVRFVYSSQPSGAEIYDSISNMQMEQSIRARKVAKTANLFVRRRVVDAIGLFPDSMKSGGDIFWTKQATSAGFTLVYAPAAEVAHPTRRLGELIKKQYRVGTGHRAVRAKERAAVAEGREVVSATAKRERVVVTPRGKFTAFKHKLGGAVRGLMPLSLTSLRGSIKQRQIPISNATLLRVWLAAWAARAATVAGTLSFAPAKRSGK